MSGIGILDLQGGVAEHVDHLQRLGLHPVRVKVAADLADLAGLIIPGGESTCLARLLRIFGLDEAIWARCRDGMRVWGVCAGAILVARRIVGEPAHLGLIDITVQRNAFGSQLDSFTAQARVPAVADTLIPLTFIRAPKIVALGPGVRPLLELDGYVAAAESAEGLATVFHPELTPCLAFHRYFARTCGLVTAGGGEPVAVVPPWTMTSWTRLARIVTPSAPAA